MTEFKEPDGLIEGMQSPKKTEKVFGNTEKEEFFFQRTLENNTASDVLRTLLKHNLITAEIMSALKELPSTAEAQRFLIPIRSKGSGIPLRMPTIIHGKEHQDNFQQMLDNVKFVYQVLTDAGALTPQEGGTIDFSSDRASILTITVIV